MKNLNERIVCADGFSMSVQAGGSSYCEPRVDGAQEYTHVEAGFTSVYEPLLAPYAENEEDYTGTVYGWVPADIIVTVCAKHGGVVTGELPNGIHYLEANNESR